MLIYRVPEDGMMSWERLQANLFFGRFEPCWTGRAAWDVYKQRHLSTLEVLDSIPVEA